MIPMHVSIDIRNRQVEKTLAEHVFSHQGISVVEKAGRVDPDIFFIEDENVAADVLKKIGDLRHEFPPSKIFVISSDPDPEHIIDVMKAGASEYFIAPVKPEKVIAAIERARLVLRQAGTHSSGSGYAFLGSKGGIGTTVLAVNTAAALATQKSNRVALLDFDLAAGDSSVLVDLVPKTTISDVIRNFHRLDLAFLSGVMEETAAGFDLLAAPASPEDASAVTTFQAGRIVEHARRLYDTHIIDCPAMAAEERYLEILRAVEKVFLITDLSVPAVRNTSRQLKFLQKADIKQTEVVVNRFLRGQTATLEEVEKTIGHRAYWLFPNDYENVIAAVNRGTPLARYNPRSALTRNIIEFTQKLQNPAAFPHYRGVKGLLGKAV